MPLLLLLPLLLLSMMLPLGACAWLCCCREMAAQFITPLVQRCPLAQSRHPTIVHPPAPCTQNRYLIILYYNATRHKGKLSLKEQEAELRRMQEKHGVDGEQRPAGKK